MKVILYNAVTVNGMISYNNDDAGFVSEAGVRNFEAMIHEAGHMIIGRKTYDVMKKDGDIRYFLDVPMIVVSRTGRARPISIVHTTARSPREALSIFRKRRCKKVLIAGGARLAASCIAQKLADEIVLYVEPLIFDPGIPLFRDSKFMRNLVLVEARTMPKGALRLHYRVAP